MDMSHHGRLERHRSGPGVGARDGCLGAALTPQRDRRDRRGALQAGRSSRSTPRTVCSTPTSIRAATIHPEKLVAQAAAPGDRGLLDHRGQRLRRNDAAAAHHRQRHPRPPLWVPCRPGPRSVSTRRDRTGPGRGDPQSACPRRAFTADVDLFEINEASPRCAWPPSSCWTSTPTWSTSAAAAARWAIRSRPPVPGCW